MKTLYKTFILLFILVGTIYPSKAQFAGPDKIVTRTNGQMDILIGMPDNSTHVCYQWQGDHIISDNEKPQIRVSPTDSVTVYNVKRISRDGIEEDQVKVFITDTVKIDSIVALHNCWLRGTPVNISDFLVYTTPANLSQQVRIARGSTTAKGEALIAETDTVVLLEAFVNNIITDKKSISIHVVNNEVMVDNTTDSKLALLSETGNLVKSKLNNIRNQMGILQGNGNISNPTQQINIQNKRYKDCGCASSKGNRVYNNNIAAIDLHAGSSYSGTCSLTGTGLLPIMPLKATIGLNLSLNYHDEIRITDCDEDNDVLLDFNPSFKANITLSVGELHKNILQGNASATTQTNIEDCRFSFTDGQIKWGDTDMEVKGNISMKLITLTQCNYEIIILESDNTK